MQILGKSDAADAYQLCELFYKEELASHRKRGIQLLNLRNLTRQQETITSNDSQTKLQLILDQVFPYRLLGRYQEAVETLHRGVTEFLNIVVSKSFTLSLFIIQGSIKKQWRLY